MPRIADENSNVLAFLDTVAYSELGPEILAGSDDGYNVLVGSRPDQILTFSSYHEHPHSLLDMNGKPGGLESTAAGRYQILARFWDAYKPILHLPDFSPESQDRYAIRQLKEQHAYDYLVAGHFEQAVENCHNIWASLPGAGYGQHENSLEKLKSVYNAKGGTANETSK